MKWRGINPARCVQPAVAVAAGLMTLWCLTAATCRHMDRSELADLAGRYEAAAAPPAKDGKGKGKSEGPAVAARERIKRVSESSLFAPPRPPAGFSAKLTGVLGDEAFFAGESAGRKVGQEFNGAKVLEIGPDWVKVSYKGKEIKLEVFGKGGGGGPSPGGPGGPRGPMPPGLRRMGPPGIVIQSGKIRPSGPTTAPAAIRGLYGGPGGHPVRISAPTGAPAN